MEKSETGTIKSAPLSNYLDYLIEEIGGKYFEFEMILYFFF